MTSLTAADRWPAASNPMRSSGRAIAAAATPAPWPRIAYAAAHVVADPLAVTRSLGRAAVDWDATMAFRHHLWALGFRIAEAMDTSQRGMGFDWAQRAGTDPPLAGRGAHSAGADLACGAGTDQLAPARRPIAGRRHRRL